MAVIEPDNHHAEVQEVGDNREQRRLLSAMLRGARRKRAADFAVQCFALTDAGRQLTGRAVVGSPAYLDKHGRPKHPLHLAQHRCIGYSYAARSETWRFTKNSKSATIRPSGPFRVNNGDAMMPALIAGTGLGILPEFILRDALAAGRLERLLPDWSLPLGTVYWVTPPGGPRPKQVEVLGDFLFAKLSRHLKRGAEAAPRSVLRPVNKAKRR